MHHDELNSYDLTHSLLDEMWRWTHYLMATYLSQQCYLRSLRIPCKAHPNIAAPHREEGVTPACPFGDRIQVRFRDPCKEVIGTMGSNPSCLLLTPTASAFYLTEWRVNHQDQQRILTVWLWEACSSSAHYPKRKDASPFRALTALLHQVDSQHYLV